MPTNLDEYLERSPWPAGRGAEQDRVEALWFHEFRSSRAELWPLLSDTSALNERLGLSAMQFEERDGKLHGETGRGLFHHEWVEMPWQWETGRSLSAERHYQCGFAHAVRVRFMLADRDGGGTRLLIYIGWVPRNWWRRLVLRLINRMLRQRYDRVLDGFDAEVAAGKAAREMARHERSASVESTVNERRLARGVRELEKQGFAHEKLELFAGYLRGASDRELHRVRPKVLAFELGVELGPLLRLLLHATRVGVLRLSWDMVCPHCRGVRREVSSLGALREYERCDVCELDFSATAMEAIEVAFRVHPEVREIGEVFYCSAEPAKKPHIWLQREIPAGGRWDTDLNAPPGRYRLRSVPGADSAAVVFDARDEGGRTVTIDVPREGEDGARFGVEFGDGLRLRNPGDEDMMVVVEEASADREALRPSELFNFQEFRDLFSEESVAPGLGLEVGQQTLLFTDIVGSSALYAERGDAEAFRVVREHFVALHDVVAERNGAVVKTIGDSMMASFSRPEDALAAAVRVQQLFCEGGESGVRLRVSIHRGACIAVKLDAGIDYFGHAVNRAAKLQVFAGAGEIAMSDTYFALEGVGEVAKEVGLEVEALGEGGATVLRGRVSGRG